MAFEVNETHLVGEGQSIVRSPLFFGDNYTYWKTRIRLFIQANNYEVWTIIVNGLKISKNRLGDEKVIKEESEWDATISKCLN